MDAYKELEITCPVCEAIKNIRIPEMVFSQKKFGTIKVQVPQGGVCKEHQFIVFVDTKGIIRGYEKIDLLMKTPTEAVESDRLTLTKLIQTFGSYGVFSLIHAKIFNYPAYVIRNKSAVDKSNIINRIADNILPEIYRRTSSIKFLEETDLNKIKLEEKNAFLMDSQNHILQTPWEEKLKFEEGIVKKALDLFIEEEQLVLLQKDILKFIHEAEYVKDLLEKVKEIYEEDLIEKISRELMIPKVNHYHLNLIKIFIKQRYSPKLSEKIKSKVEDFLGLI